MAIARYTTAGLRLASSASTVELAACVEDPLSGEWRRFRSRRIRQLRLKLKREYNKPRECDRGKVLASKFIMHLVSSTRDAAPLQFSVLPLAAGGVPAA